VGALILLAGMAFAACGPSATTNGGHGSPTAGPKRGGTITDGLYEEPDSLLPEASVETFADMVDAGIWAPLFYGDNNEVIHAGLAMDVPTTANGGISADLKTYKFTLRDGLKWSDGSPLTADDVVFTLNLFKDKAYGKKQTFASSEIDSVSSSGNTVTIQLNTPDVTFLALSLTDPLIFAPLPRSVFGSMMPADVRKSPQAFQPTVVSGPFTITDRAKADHITLKRNPNYYQSGLPYLDGVTFRIITDQNTILTALKSGEIQSAWDLDINKLNDYKNITGYTAWVDPSPGSFEAIYFNEKNPILADPVVRKAITQAIDRSAIINQIWLGQAKPTCDDGPGTFADEPSLDNCYTLNPAAAASALDGDGWKMGSDGYRHKGGKTLELRYSTTAGKAYREQTELVVQDELKTNIGMKIDIVNNPADTFFGTQLYDYTAYDIAEFANSLSYDPDNFTQWESDQTTDKGGFNVSDYVSTDADAQIKIERGTDNQATRTTAFHQLYQDIVNDLPAMYYYKYPNIAAYANNLHNYTPSPVGPSETWNIWEWWVS
jgi:peptide/nickel transport system substrate-binding protein